MYNLTRELFFNLEQRLKKAGLDSDAESFDCIKKRLCTFELLGPDDFAEQAIYVILAGGFSQKTAKNKHAEIMKYIKKAGKMANLDDLLQIFNNKNKASAILKIWQNRQEYRDGYYTIGSAAPTSLCAMGSRLPPLPCGLRRTGRGNDERLLERKLSYLAAMPHIGKITAGHLARNLGENVVKYDIWIQRLGVAFAGRDELKSKIDNGKLDPEVKAACDEMFSRLERETGLPRGYIDVVLWKACQNGLIEV
jgi:hypothetical protein